MKLDTDFSGCYVLHDKGNAIYTGISRSVISRLRQHVCGKTHFDANLAYKMAVDAFRNNKTSIKISDMTRSQAMAEPCFIKEFEKAKVYLQSLSVAYVQIDNPLVLYVFKPFCAMELKTGKWNTFKTH